MCIAEYITHTHNMIRLNFRTQCCSLNPVRPAVSGEVFSLIFEGSVLITSVVSLRYLSAYTDQSGLSLETPCGLRLCVPGINKLHHCACLCVSLWCVCSCLSETERLAERYKRHKRQRRAI